MKLPDLSEAHLYSHAGCMDGSMSAILFRYAGGKKNNVHWVAAGRAAEELRQSETLKDPEIPILMVDISPDPEFARYLVARGNVWIIDHHKTAVFLNGMHPNFYVDINNDACGCENFRRVLVENKIMPIDGWTTVDWDNKTSGGFDAECFVRVCRIIDDHDRWQLKIPFAMEMPKFFAFVGQKDFIERMMNVRSRFQYEKESYWEPFEQDLMKLLKRIQESKYRAAFQKMQIHNRKMLGKSVVAAYLISDEVNNSEMLNLYLNEHPEVDVAIQISFGLQKVSLRSNDRVDVALFSQQYGGGGHKNAAGHPLPKGMIAEIIEEVHNGARS